MLLFSVSGVAWKYLTNAKNVVGLVLATWKILLPFFGNLENFVDLFQLGKLCGAELKIAKQ